MNIRLGQGSNLIITKIINAMRVFPVEIINSLKNFDVFSSGKLGNLSIGTTCQKLMEGLFQKRGYLALISGIS